MQPETLFPNSIRSALADEPGLAEILPVFLAELPLQVRRLLNLIQRRDAKELRRLIHQIKGCGGGYGFQSLTDLARDIECQLMSNAPIENIATKVEELVQTMRLVEGYDRKRETLTSDA